MLSAATAKESRSTAWTARGVVVAARDVAARAGARILAAGGNAGDAAVAAAGVLGVVDPANCGVGGYGGFAVVHRRGQQSMQVDFNAAVPRALRDPEIAGRRAPGAQVTPPSVVAGLCALHRQFGRLAASAVWAPAIDLARDGFTVGRGLATALRWAYARHRGLNAAFRRTFFAGGQPLREGATLVQSELAQTYERIAAVGAQALRQGDIVATIVDAANAAGGALSVADFDSLDAKVTQAADGTYRSAKVWTPAPEQCGASVLLAALERLDGVEIGESRQELYVKAFATALTDAWRRREAAYQPLLNATSQTSHLCVADPDGMLVSMTFTHGPVWFGSGLATDESGMVLNCGAHLLARRVIDDAIVAQPHLTPAIVQDGETAYALGSPGGRRIPAIVLQAIVDLVHYGVAVDRVFDAPRLSANADGSLEAEGALADAFPQRTMRRLDAGDFFGPAGAIALTPRGGQGVGDPRFEDACVAAA